MRAVLGCVVSLCLATVGCGGDSNTFSCLSGSGTSQLCIDTTTTSNVTPNCGASTRVDACPHAGSDGGCVHSFSAGGATLEQKIWYYSGSATATSQEMSDCANNGGSWVQP
jgi:hypothetical protein